MSVWAYVCRGRENEDQTWFVARTDVNELPGGTDAVLVKVGRNWMPAIVDRSHPLAVESMLIRKVIADRESVAEPPADNRSSTDARNDSKSPEKQTRPALPREAESFLPDRTIELSKAGNLFASSGTRQVIAAAISLEGRQFIIVLVRRELAESPGEGRLVVTDLEPRFGVPVVLMGQDEDGTPIYHGDANLVDLLANVPVDKFPWREYTLP